MRLWQGWKRGADGVVLSLTQALHEHIVTVFMSWPGPGNLYSVRKFLSQGPKVFWIDATTIEDCLQIPHSLGCIRTGKPTHSLREYRQTSIGNTCKTEAVGCVLLQKAT